MCNHYRNDPEALEAIQTWLEYIEWSIDASLPQAANDIYPKRHGLIIRQENGHSIADAMHWGFPWTGKGKRPGTTKKMNTTNIEPARTTSSCRPNGGQGEANGGIAQ